MAVAFVAACRPCSSQLKIPLAVAHSNPKSVNFHESSCAIASGVAFTAISMQPLTSGLRRRQRKSRNVVFEQRSAHRSIARGAVLLQERLDAVSLLSQPEKLTCVLPRGPEAAALDSQWNSRLEVLPEFDVSVDIDGLSAQQDAEWIDRLTDQLPHEMRGDLWRPLILETIEEAKRLLDAFRPAGAVAMAEAVLSAPLRLRFAGLHGVQCSRLHWDDVPLRAIAVLAGAGTDVLPEHAVDRNAFAEIERKPIEYLAALTPAEFNHAVVARGLDLDAEVVATPPGNVLFLKGSEWRGMQRTLASGTQLGAVHRSPPFTGRRVLLQVDFADVVFTPALDIDDADDIFDVGNPVAASSSSAPLTPVDVASTLITTSVVAGASLALWSMTH